MHRTGQVEHSEQDEHQRDGEFEGESEARRNYYAEEDDGGADNENGEGVSDSPEDADPASAGDGTLPADNGGDGDDMVGIGGVTHAEKESDAKDEEGAGHSLVMRASSQSTV